jgi:hypothetical protein
MSDRAPVHHEGLAYFELKFRPSVTVINVVRRFVADFYREVLDDPDVVSRVALATHELLENAVRYSTDGETTVRIDIGPFEGREALTIRIANFANEDNRSSLAKLIDEMHAADDPMDHYCQVMRRNAKRTEGSGLGLARIRAEAEMTLDLRLDEDRVTIFARAMLTADPESSRVPHPSAKADLS